MATATVVMGALPASAGVAPQQSALGAEGLIVNLFERTLDDDPGLFVEQLDDNGGGSCGCDTVYPVHDLNLDGTDEVVDAQLHEESDVRSTELNVRDGKDGAFLFAQPAQLPGYAYASSATVGPDGQPGLVYQSYNYTISAGYVLVFELTIGALDASGRQLWQRQWVHAFTLGSLLPGFQDLHLIHQRDEVTRIVIAQTAMDDDAHLLILEEVAADNGVTTAMWTGDTPDAEMVYLRSADDLFGDGGTGFLAQIYPMISERTPLLAFAEVGSGPRWTQILPRYAYVLGVANLLGGRVPEVVVRGGGRNGLLELRSGATGEVLWDRDINAVRIVDDAGGDGRHDLLLAHGGFVKVGGRLKAEVRRFEPGSGTLWRRHVAFDPGEYWDWKDVWAESTGDADLDGGSDVVVGLSSWTFYDDEIEIVRNKQVLLNGRTGRLMDQGRDLFPLEGTLDGVGADGVRVSARRGPVVVSGVDGRNGESWWRTKLDVEIRLGWDPCLWHIEVVDGTGSDDVLLIIPTGGADEEVLIDGVSGKVLWHLHK